MARSNLVVLSEVFLREKNNEQIFYYFFVVNGPFNKGCRGTGTFTGLKWSLVPPDFKECCIKYS